MRKLLLATVAALGASMGVASYADAQIVVDDNNGQSFPTPGSVTVRLNGRFRFYAGYVNNGAEGNTNYGVASPTGTGTGVTAVQTTNASTASSGSTLGTIAAGTSNQGINKTASYGITSYARLYPGFDGVAANGLKYGASLEIRQDNNFGAGGGVYGSTTGQDRTRNLLYFRREWGYIGTDQFGTLRVGASDNPGSLYLTGTFETFDDGGLNGDLPGMLSNGGLVNYPFEDVGNIYGTTKIVYLSPQAFGFDGGVSFEPSTAGGGGDNGAGCGPSPQFGNFNASGAGAASPGCDYLTSTSTADYQRRANTYQALLRYRGTFGPVGIAATAEYTGSGRVHDSGIVGSTTNPKHQKLEDLSYGDFGLALTYGGLSFGGNVETGRYSVLAGSGPGGLLNRGSPNSTAYIIGATYTIGPVIFGAHGLQSWYEGDRQTATNTNQTTGAFTGGTVQGGRRKDSGIAAGATYSLAPGVSIFLSGIYEEAKQRGYNLVTGASNNAYNNKLSQSVVALGTSFAW